YCGGFNVDTSGSGAASFHIITSGRCVLASPDDGEPPVDLEAGDLVVFPRDQQHRLCDQVDTGVPVNSAASVPFTDGVRDDGAGLVCGFIEFDHPASNPLLASLPDSIVVKSSQAPWDRHLGPLLRVLIAESHSVAPGVQVTLNRLSDVIFVLLIRERLAQTKDEDGLAAALTDERIGRALQALHGALDAPWTVDLLASEAAMSRSAFAARFSTLLGESPMQYLTNARMAAAYRWLKDDGVPVAVAAEKSGYATEAAFSKAFKRSLGVSPGAVRAG
ncbi:MAG: AraC family transcriptional regulator, partial [Pseudomonadota bacterium]